ncbi:hypothetical protein [Enhygromyxa salina]|uniref:hypothetical protein n=1 Tax=Enhygromyxa salina TaxID=215803 RepID=UPI0011B20E76|nr:hypothetical protein [Enhygromyxa salina]
MPTHWDGARLVDGPTSRNASPWGRILGVVILLLGFDLALGMIPSKDEREQSGQAFTAEPNPATGAELRRTLEAATTAASEGRSLLLIGDSVLAGDVLAADRPHDWQRHRVIDYMQRELAGHADASLHQIALDGLLPVDALHLVAELDRIDPAGRVELVLEINLRYFSAQYAEQRECTRDVLCKLGTAAFDAGGRPLLRSWQGLVTAAAGTGDWLRERVPVHRRRPRLELERLDALSGLAVVRGADGSDEAIDQTPSDASELDELDELDGEAELEGRARVREHYRSAALRSTHEQLRALDQLLEHLDAHDRPATLFVTPLEDRFAEATMGESTLGRRYTALARKVNDHEDPKLQLVDLDHPLFVDAHFIDHVHLWPDGARLLAINLLHELNLPLAQRPFEAMMIHPEGHDRSLVHRVSTGYNEGGAWQAELRKPEGVAVSADGTRVVVADTQNHVLRELRGNMQFVETIAGRPREPDQIDGWARVDAHLVEPREPELRGDEVWFIDGEQREQVRVLDDDWVRTVRWSGPSCASYLRLRARAGGIWMLCGDGRLLLLDVDHHRARAVSEVSMSPLVAFDVGPTAAYLGDADGRLWQRELVNADTPESLELGTWDLVFRNVGEDLLPNGHRVGFPYHYDELRLAKIVDLRFIERYGGLLIADEFPLENPSESLEKRWTERVHLRYFDLDAARVLPWLKPLTHGDGHVLYNESVDQYASYWHLGSMAIAQDDASMIWVERQRSRIVRIADGLLGVAKTGNHHTKAVTVPILMTIASVGPKVAAQLRPDRYLDRRYEPLARRGPYVALLLGSSLSSMSDRYSNYSLGRRLEQELQRELGYRDGVRLDLFQVSWGAASFGENVNNFANWMGTSVPPDVVFIEAQDFGGSYVRDTKTPGEVNAAFAKLQRFAERYDTLVVFYDLSSIESNRRDGMRSTDSGTRRLLDKAEQLGFVVLDPGDRLLPQLLTHSPWGNQPFDDNQHHGSTWAVDITAHTLSGMVGPLLRDFFADRVPAREREVDPAVFDANEGTRRPLRLALEELELDGVELPDVSITHVQTNYVNRQLQVYVDTAGLDDAMKQASWDRVAAAVIVMVLQDDLYADLAESLSLELVEFSNYDEYGNGVLSSANSVWARKFDGGSLRNFMRKHAR